MVEGGLGRDGDIWFKSDAWIGARRKMQAFNYGLSLPEFIVGGTVK